VADDTLKDEESPEIPGAESPDNPGAESPETLAAEGPAVESPVDTAGEGEPPPSPALPLWRLPGGEPVLPESSPPEFACSPEAPAPAAPSAGPLQPELFALEPYLPVLLLPAPVPPAAPQQLHVLAVSDLHKRFGRKEVVRGVNFSMHNGEVAGLLGPNGAGKTTIFYMIVGFYRPSAGRVTMNDVDITSKPMFRRARQGIAYLPQEASIFRKLTVEQNLWAILESRRDINKAEKKERLEILLDEFGIGRIRRQYGFTLSGGERRRTEIARALATEPKFLLLDEPFAGIDPIAVYEIKQIIRRLAEKGIGILITDHNVRDTLEITTEAFIIADGTIVARGDREVILADEMVRQVYLGSEFRM
jgi:lipopolysaccharide export system ATP-binding protein